MIALIGKLCYYTTVWLVFFTLVLPSWFKGIWCFFLPHYWIHPSTRYSPQHWKNLWWEEWSPCFQVTYCPIWEIYIVKCCSVQGTLICEHSKWVGDQGSCRGWIFCWDGKLSRDPLGKVERQSWGVGEGWGGSDADTARRGDKVYGKSEGRRDMA